ncbi:DUF4245 domain-containing protein [Protaetiibacter larvae]|uniref:DUF4245 domain-containing protein n=1 Tax=Protaetiibacter larvae TaxID=2592654 RepID=UPI00143DAA78|nr:DUF4245 domain-containing protein [Protaetiibacter larvae]
MSPRQPGVDADGRPIVAELGRAETAQETAERKAAASAKRRNNQTVLNLSIATVASVLIAIFLVYAVGLTDQGSRIDPVDYRAAAEAAQDSFSEPLATPQLSDDWSANRAEIVRGSDGVTSWQIGFVTPNQRYIALIQAVDANPSWLADTVRDAQQQGTRAIGGRDWQVYDRRDASDPGNVAFALVTVSGASTIVLAGTADDPEFEVLAEAVAAELDS